MNINELKEGEIYYLETKLFKYIVKYINSELFNERSLIKGLSSISILTKHYNKSYQNPGRNHVLIEEATPEQKHWLNECEKANKFISYDDAMKSFVKEFVLPEKWRLQLTKENSELLFNWAEFKFDYYPYHFWIYSTKTWNMLDASNLDSVEITFDQFKQYVLKEVVIEEVKLPYQILVKHNEDIIEVANEEGNVFKIGDRVKSLKRQYPSTITRFVKGNTAINAITSNFIKGISIDKIEHYIEPKVKVVVITDSHVDQLKLHNQGINAIVIQPEESLLDKAKRLYPIGTKFCNSNIIPDCKSIINITQSSFQQRDSGDLYTNHNCTNGVGIYTIYSKSKDQWAEIINKPEVDNSKYEILSLIGGYGNKPLILNDKPNINSWIEGYNFNYKIHSVKQLSTGNIFTVGDNIELKLNKYKGIRIIKSINLVNNQIQFNLESLDEWYNANTVLLQNVTKI